MSIAESSPVQSWVKGNIHSIQNHPTMIDLLDAMNAKVGGSSIMRTRRTPLPYRNKISGDGVCQVCLKPKKNEEFATKSGYLCIECKHTDKRKKRI